MPPGVEHLVVDRSLDGARLDRALRTFFPEWGRQGVDRVIRERRVQVNGRTVYLASWNVHTHDELEVDTRGVSAKPTGPQALERGWVLWQGGGIVVIDKPSGLRTEPTRAHDGIDLQTLASEKFGPVVPAHRLDRDTSGVVLLVRRDSSPALRRAIAAAFEEHTVVKRYLAVVQAPNRLKAEGTIIDRLAQDPAHRDRMIVVTKGGQGAITQYRRLEQRDGAQLLSLEPKTGRTHQLRVHCAARGAAILGDRLYGDVRSAPRLLLHAHELVLPDTVRAELPGAPTTLEAPVPDALR